MRISLNGLSDQELDALIKNHERLKAHDKPRYAEALYEREQKRGAFACNASLACIYDAAKVRRFLSYKELADASGAEWNKVYRALGRHLWMLVACGHARRWPMLSAVVVNKRNILSGTMEPEALQGFISAAEQLKYVIVDHVAFLREQQEQVFQWAQAHHSCPILP